MGTLQLSCVWRFWFQEEEVNPSWLGTAIWGVDLGSTVLLSYSFCIISRSSLPSSDRKLSINLSLLIEKLAPMILYHGCIFYELALKISGWILSLSRGEGAIFPVKTSAQNLSMFHLYLSYVFVTQTILMRQESVYSIHSISRQIILHYHPHADQIMRWMCDQVDIQEFPESYQGTFKAVSYRSDFPPSKCFSNHRSCKGFFNFLASEILKLKAIGVLWVWWRVGVNDFLLGIASYGRTIELRLCLDGRYLKLWTCVLFG